MVVLGQVDVADEAIPLKLVAHVVSPVQVGRLIADGSHANAAFWQGFETDVLFTAVLCTSCFSAGTVQPWADLTSNETLACLTREHLTKHLDQLCTVATG